MMIIEIYVFSVFKYQNHLVSCSLRWYLTLQGDNSVKSAERFNDVVFIREY